MRHLVAEEIAGFLAGRAQDGARVLAHLLAGCERCLKRVIAAAPPQLWDEEAEERDGGPVDAYDEPMDRAWKVLRGGRARARRDLERFTRGLEAARAKGLLGMKWSEIAALRGWPYVQILLELSFEERYRDPREMLQLADSARSVAEELDPEVYGESFVADVQARAWAELGNARRVNEDYPRADAALAEARRRAEQGTGDVLLWARIDELEASLRRAQRRYPEALALLDSVVQRYREIGDLHLAGRASIIKGTITQIDPREAAGFLREGLSLIDTERDPQLVAVGEQALLDALVDAGELGQAGQLLLEGGLRKRLGADPPNLLRLRWVEGKIQAGRGRLASAERIFREVRASFCQKGLHYVGGVVGMDLAGALLRQDKQQEAGELAEELFATFEDLGIQPEATRALHFFHIVCRERAATPAIAARVGSFLKRLESEPGLRFEPEAMLG
ncbi:MAG TPA: hypothetical protein VF756_05315 [Thermoanaerobaculia bacterium]